VPRATHATTKELPWHGLKLTGCQELTGAGDEKNKMMTALYALYYNSKDETQEIPSLARKKPDRDHR